MHVIEILGPGCQRCRSVEATVRDVVARAGLEARIDHVTDYAAIVSRGVMETPGLVIDGAIMSTGRIPTREQVAAWLGVAAAPLTQR